MAVQCSLTFTPAEQQPIYDTSSETWARHTKSLLISPRLSYHTFPSFVPQNGTRPPLAPDVSLDEVARLCANFSGADCDQLVYLAGKELIREVIHSSSSSYTASSPVDTSSDTSAGSRLVARRHFSAALKKAKPSISAEVGYSLSVYFSCKK